jgi:capsular polysaccharide biosynthesis protein
MYQTFNLYSPLSPPEDYYESTPDWVECSPLAKTKILSELYPPMPVPAVLREEETKLLTGKPECSNKAFVAKIPYGRVWGEKAVISPDNKLLWDVSVEWARWPQEHSIFQQKKMPPLTKTEKTVAVLNHPAAYNYYHWMLEVLARIHLLQKSRFTIDKYIINHRALPFQLETLALCGITPEKIIRPPVNFHLQAKQLVVPSYVNLPNQWSVNYVRNIFLSPKIMPPESEGKRIYIKRQSSRKVLNEEELLIILNKYNFKSIVLEEIPLKKQLEIFYNAMVIVAPHGAGLANLVFCKPGTTVIELFSPSFLEPHYWLISRLLHLQYRFIVGKRENPHHYWTGFDDLSIAPDQLLKALENIDMNNY